MSTLTRSLFATLALPMLGLMIAGGSRARDNPPVADPVEHVNPELRPLLPRIEQLGRPVTAQFIAQVRKMGAAAADRPPPEGWVKEEVPGRNGAPSVAVYIHNVGPEDEARPAILYMHGGGYVLGSGKGGGPLLERIAKELDVAIVSVEYRLAPETRFPGSLEDNYAALAWVHENARQLGVDRSRIALLGESAGGGHAAMLAIAARDRGEYSIAFQALIYPMLDDRTGSTRQEPPWRGAFVWTPESNRFGWTSLLGVPAGSKDVPRGSVPSREQDLSGLPATWIGVGSIDLFAHEDIDYAERLMDAGVMTSLDVYPGAFHGFNLFSQGSLSKTLEEDVIAALRSGLGIR